MFENMDYIYVVYKERSFSKAADKLYITQPSLSATIKKVEARLGTQLFDRSYSPIRLTDSGAEYIKCIEKMMDIRSSFQAYLDDLEGLQAGGLSIGASNFFASYILPPIITRYKERYPHVQIELAEADTAHLERRLFSGEIDMIIDNYSFNEAVYQRHYFSSEVLLLAVPEHIACGGLEQYRLTADDILAGRHLDAAAPALPLALLEGVPFVLLRHGNDTRDRADRIFAGQGFTPQITLELDQLATAYRVASSGMGATLISDTLVKVSLPDPRVFYCKFGSADAGRDTYFYYKRKKYVSQAMRAFLATAECQKEMQA